MFFGPVGSGAMPRRAEPDHLALAIGQRVRQLRQEAGLTLEKLAYEGSPDEGRPRLSKGHLSSLERGLVMPTIATLTLIAEQLGILVADVIIDPEATPRERVINLTRRLGPGALQRLANDLEAHKLTCPLEIGPLARRG
jgi:transcriptional regulator with XRE-family HTH domain